MRDRVASVGGTFSLASPSGLGTQIKVVIWCGCWLRRTRSCSARVCFACWLKVATRCRPRSTGQTWSRRLSTRICRISSWWMFGCRRTWQMMVRELPVIFASIDPTYRSYFSRSTSRPDTASRWW